jgi:Mg-chelatase subunit ChlD
MNLLLDQPIWMSVIAIGLLASMLGWRLLRGLPTARRIIIVGSRFASFLCFALALAGLQHVQQSDRLTVIAAIDTSGSIQGYANLGLDDLGYPITIQDASLGFLLSGTQSSKNEDRLGIIAFDGHSSVTLAPRELGFINDVSLESNPVDGTDIAAAITRAQSLIPSDSKGRIVLISDGVSTAGSIENAVLSTPVDIVPIEYSVTNEVLVESVEIPSRVAQDSMMPVRVTMRSTAPANGRLKLIVDGQTVNLTPDTSDGGLPLALTGGTEPIAISVPIGSGRVHRVRAIWEPELSDDGTPIGDTNTLNNESSALTLTSDHGRALIVTTSPDIEAKPLTSLLGTVGWDIETTNPAEVPTDLLGLEPYDLIVLVNTPRDALMPGIETAFDDYVRDLGGGLVFVGGYEALGAGGWNAPDLQTREDEKGLIADLLPVNLEIPDDVVTTHAAVALVLDSSGSMQRSVMGSSRSQQSVANNSAAGAIGVLDPTDMVTVVSFSGQPNLIVPITKNDDPEMIQNRIKSIASGGGTNLAPAMRVAAEQLRSVDSKTKHIVVLSDGESQNSSLLPGLAQALGTEGIKVSTITIGDDADEQTMRLIATNSGGVYYRVVNPAVLPRIFLKAIRVLRRPMVREGQIRPIVVDASSPMLTEAGSRSIPTLSGLVLTEHKSDDPRVMVPIVSDQGEPILAGHQVELGRVAVFTSDASEWAGDWSGSPSFVSFWIHLVQWAGRAEDPGVGELSINRSLKNTSGGLKIDYTAIDDAGVPIDGLTIASKVFSDGSSQTVNLVQTGPGQYSALLDSVPSGDHVVVVTPKRDGQPIRPTIGAVHVDDQTEYDTLRSDRAALESIASRSGGRVLSLSQAADLFSRDGLAEVSSYESMWRLMLLLGFILFLIDLGARRVAWDRWIAQARAETIAVSRAVNAQQLDALKKKTKQTQPQIHIESQPVRRQRSVPTAIQQTDESDLEELSSLMAAKKRARERMDDS